MAPAGGETSSPAASASSNMGTFGRVDAMAERGVDHDGHHVGRVLGQVLAYRLIELREAGQGTAFGGQIGTVDDDSGEQA